LQDAFRPSPFDTLINVCVFNFDLQKILWPKAGGSDILMSIRGGLSLGAGQRGS
jgi:hypothetical protein